MKSSLQNDIQFEHFYPPESDIFYSFQQSALISFTVCLLKLFNQYCML
jgi:hypothetical protein